jgi:acetylglutamate kinase
MQDAIRKAEALIEALQYVRTFHDQLTVVKLGGSAMEEPAALRTTLQDVVALAALGLRPILVHGGGKAIDRAMAAAGLAPRKIEGRRVTDAATLEIVVRTLQQESAGLVALVRELGGKAIAVHSGPHQALFGEKLLLPGAGGHPIDLGHVGAVTRVDGWLLTSLARAGILPIVPCIAQTASGAWLNVNGDTAAAAVAGQTGAEKLLFLTDTPGILLDRHRPETLQRSLDAATVEGLIATRVIADGMIPKVEACLDALRGGVRKTHMIDGRLPHALLLEIFTDTGVGTEIVLKRAECGGRRAEERQETHSRS